MIYLSSKHDPSVERIPLWLKLAYTAWMIIWIPSYAAANGLQNFLWLCDVCNFVLLAAFWTESSLLFSSQLAGTLIIDLLWCVDVLGALATGIHIIGGTQYMFDASIALPIRMLSLFHVLSPVLIIYSVLKLGYDRRGPFLQTGMAWLIFLLTFFLTDPKSNINWVFYPTLDLVLGLDLTLYRILLVIGYPLVVCVPMHSLALHIFPRAHREREASEGDPHAG